MANELNTVKQLLLDTAEQAGPLDVSLADVTTRVRRRRRVRTSALGLVAGCLAAGAVMAVQVADGSSSRPMVTSVSAQPAAAPPTGPTCVATSAPASAATSAPASVAASGAAPPPIELSPDTRSCQYVGLTLEAARAQAAKEHRELQIISQDGVSSGPFTFEFRTFRVRVTVVNDRVTSAFIG
ncbi:hypothetical protein P3T35_004024 [Kitasatospora sp. GP30]|uniref:hypothetical protein n=1 Tax=Kitasatospora sp. GP30 TaxID=3035084 RepID=UPI000CA820A5|nr:hypothetical protein [Kitasatospora sp. GP30]MDH6142003.1 hypothetical protein [Kitasatospora sp. GP30]